MTEPATGWRIDDLARRAGLTVDTIRFYQREGLLPPAVRAGRTKVYGREHLERLERIRELQARRFSLAAIRALQDADRPELVEEVFSGGGALSYDLEDLVERSGVDPALVADLRKAGLLRDPEDFGRSAYDATDLDVLRAVAGLRELGMPPGLVTHLASIYVEGVEAMQARVVELFADGPGPDWDPTGEGDGLGAPAASQRLLPLVGRLVEYVHQRTIQRLALLAIERAAQTDGEVADA